MASEYRKPGGVTVIEFHIPHSTFHIPPREDNHSTTITLKNFLEDRPAAAIPGIGRRRNVHAEAEGWKTAWDIALADTGKLVQLFGRPGRDMQRELLGEELFPVQSESNPPKSVSRARSFSPLKDRELLWAHCLRHLEYIVLKMRRHALACRGVSVWLRDDRYEGYGSSHRSLPQQFDTEERIRPYLQECFDGLLEPGKHYTQVGAALWNLSAKGTMQLSLFEEVKAHVSDEDVQRSLDELHERFGRNVITRGAALEVRTGTKRSFEVPAYEGK